MGLFSLVIAKPAALIGTFLAMSSTKFEGLNPWFDTLGIGQSHRLLHSYPRHSRLRPFGKRFPLSTSPSPTLLSRRQRKRQHQRQYQPSPLFSKKSTTGKPLRRNRRPRDWFGNFGIFGSCYVKRSLEARSDARSRAAIFLGRILPITRSRPHGRSVTRRPVSRNYALRRAVFGLPALRSAPPPAAAPVAPPSPSLLPIPSWPDSPPYPLSAFSTRIRDLQQEVKDLKGQLQEMQRRQSTAARRVASGLPGVQHVFGTGSAPLQPTGFGGGFEYNFRFSPFTLAPVAPVIPCAIVRPESSTGPSVLGTVEEGAGHRKGGFISRSSAIGLQLRKSRHV